MYIFLYKYLKCPPLLVIQSVKNRVSYQNYKLNFQGTKMFPRPIINLNAYELV